MSMKTDIKKNQALILHNRQIGYVRAWALEDKENRGVGLAFFRVSVNSVELPGISEAVINVNSWDVYDANDPVVLKMIAQKYVPEELTR